MRIRDTKKEAIIREKALQMFMDEGFDGFSMQKLAKAADVSPATLYIYFKDREDLILQIYTEIWKKMADATLVGFNPEMSLEEGLKIQWINRANYCLENPQEMHLMEQIKYSPLYEKSLQCAQPYFQETMKKFIQNAIANKEIVKIPFEVYWSIAFAPLYNLIKFHFTGHSKNGERFVFNHKTMMHTLQLVLKALKP